SGVDFQLSGTAWSVYSDDYLLGTEFYDMLEGFAGNDTLIGLGDNDDLFGGQGDDEIDGGADNDWIEGGQGNDTLTGGSGLDHFQADLYENYDTMEWVGFGHDIITDFGDGDVFDVYMYGYSGPAPVVTYIGSDTEIRFGAPGSPEESSVLLQNYLMDPMDYYDGGGWVSITGTMMGVLADDLLIGTEYGDILEGFGGNDTLIGLGEADDLLGGTGMDEIDAGDGDDWIDGGRGDDLLTGGPGMDYFSFYLEEDYLTGDFYSFGHDIITDFGDGDVVEIQLGGYMGPDPVVTYLGDDTEIRFGAPGSDEESSILLQNYHLELMDLHYYGSWATIDGFAYSVIQDDLLIGTEYGDDLEGFAGNDTLIGLGDNDNLMGDTGNDELDGGEGDDW
ncbi:MAG: calcium-binding protein, partial [Mangrovicoccus sp.]